MTLIQVACAVCGGTDFNLVYPGGLDAQLDASAYFSSSRQSAAYPDIVRCRSCSMVMANPRDDEQTLARVYGEMRDQAYDAEDANRTVAAVEHLRILGRELTPPGRVLDVGCASGFFVKAAAEAGFDVVGADASHWMIAQAKRRAPSANFIVGTLESLQLDAQFDAITLWDVLEHVHSPPDVIRRLHGWLKPGGRLLMSMPNSRSLVARTLGSRWVLLLREHLWYFSPKTIEQLLQQCGFELVRTESKWVTFSVASIVSRLSQYGGALSPLRRASDWASLKRAPIRFPIGEMNVVARRL